MTLTLKLIAKRLLNLVPSDSMVLTLMTLGNLCIEGHNYKKVFTYLTNLVVGDSFFIVSKDGRKVTYTITDMIRGVDPHDMSHIEQNSDNIRKVTLITCDPRRTHEIFGKSRTKSRK